MQPKFTQKRTGNFFKLNPRLLILLCFFAVKANAQPCTWTAAPVYPLTILDQAVATVGTNLYSFTGITNGAWTTNSYKFDGTVWTPIAPYPGGMEYPAAVSDGTNIFILGGAIITTGVPQTTMYRYNVALNTYTLMAPFSTPTWNQTAVYMAGKIYKFCGTGAAATNVLEIYDIASNTWTPGANYPISVSFASGYAQGGFIWAAGGYDGANPSAKAYRYDPVANSWNDAAMTDLPAGRWGAAYGAYNNGFIMAGGYVGTNPSNTVVSWDMAGNSWTALPNMIGDRARMNGAVQGLNFHVIGGRSTGAPGTGFVGTNNNQQLNCIAAAPCTGTPAPGNTISTPNPVCPSTDFTLSPQNATSGSGVTYQWQSSPDGSSWTDIPFGTGASHIRQQTVATYYRVRVTCGANSAFTVPLQVNMSPVTSCYCLPTYTNGCAGFGDFIARVRLNTLDNPSACTPAPYYTYYSALPDPEVFSGAVNPITLTAGTTDPTQFFGVWIDLNVNGSFNDPGEFMGATGNAGSGGTVILNMVIPSTATPGTTRMRVRGGDDSAPSSTQSCGASNSTFGEAEDYDVTIVPCVPATFSSHPSNASVQCSGTTSFSVSSGGSLPSFTWQNRINAGAPWQTVSNDLIHSGATTATLTLSNVPNSMSGYQYRALVTGACSAVDFSNFATLTVTPLIATVTPAGPVTLCNGQIQSLQLTNIAAPVQLINEGFNTVVPLPAGWASQNLSAPLGPSGWFQGNSAVFPAQSGAPTSYIGANYLNTDPVGTISNWLFTPNITMNNGNTFKFWTRKVAPDAFPDRLEVRMSTNGASVNVGATSTSVGDYTNLLLSVNPTLVTGVYPTVWTEYTITISGLAGPTSGRLAFRYFVTDGGFNGSNSDYIGIDNVTYTAGGAALGVWTQNPAAPNSMFSNALATTPYGGLPANQIWVKPTVTTTYTVVYTSGGCTSAPTNILVNVVNPVGTITNPVNASACLGGSATFTSSATGGPLTYQWEVSTNGGATYTAIPGATTPSLTVTNVTQIMNNNRYRLVFNAAACASTNQSTGAILTVNPLPIVTITAPTIALVPGVSTTITASSTPGPQTPTSWTWFYNGTNITDPPPPPTVNAGNTIGVDVDHLGTYQVRVVDVNGCTSLSNELVIGAQSSENLWIYPNPSDGQIQVRVYFDGPHTDFREVRIFNMSGQLVARKAFDLFVGIPPYLQMDFDLRHLAAGTYVVKVEEKYTQRIKSGLLVIQ